MEKKKIPLKNYIILLLAMVFTMLAVFYMLTIYKNYEEYYNNNSIILDIVNEINSEEIVSYSTDNPDFILYVSSGHNQEIKAFEKNLKKFVLKNDLRNNMLYLNLDDVNIEEFNNFLNKMSTKNVKSELSNQDSHAIYIFQNCKIEQVLDTTDLDKIEIVFQGYGMIEND